MAIIRALLLLAAVALSNCSLAFRPTYHVVITCPEQKAQTVHTNQNSHRISALSFDNEIDGYLNYIENAYK